LTSLGTRLAKLVGVLVDSRPGHWEVVMRCLAGFVYLLAGLLALPLVASAETGEEESTSAVERWHPEAFADPDKPALQLELDSTGLEVTPSGPRTVDGYTLEEMDRRVRRAQNGVGFSVVALGVGGAMSGGAIASSICFTFGGEGSCPPPRRTNALVGVASFLMVAGLAMTIVSGVALRRRKRERDRLREAGYGRPRRVQWDPSQSRFAF
jgi:hypothetical protein